MTSRIGDYKSNISKTFQLDPSASRKGKEMIENREHKDGDVNCCACNKASMK